MNDAHRFSHRPACTYRGGRSPLQMLEESFLALVQTTAPLTLPAYLVCTDPEQSALSVDQVRARLAHPATAPVMRAQTWREVVRRAQRIGDPWDTVAVAMAVPVLRRMLARLARPAHLERAEVEQEALAAVAAAVRAVDVNADDVGRELFAAADRAVHRLAYAARRSATREVSEPAARLGRLAHFARHGSCPSEVDPAQVAEHDGGSDEYTVPARAVREHVVDVSEARLIARTRLEGEPMRLVAGEGRVSARQLYRRRADAEQRLATHLRDRLREA